MHPRSWLVLSILILTASLFWGNPSQAAPSGELSLFSERPLEYSLWFKSDREHLKALAPGLRDPSPLIRSRTESVLRHELSALRLEFARIMRNEAVTHTDRRFRIYSAPVTGKLMALDLAYRSRRQLLKTHGLKGLEGSLLEFQGYRLYPTTSSRQVEPEEVAGALESMRLPRQVFAGYRVYLLPYSMGNVSGAGGNGYAFIGAHPLNTSLIENQVAITTTHEFGHYLAFRYIGGAFDDNPSLWSQYMKARGIPEWRADGAVNTADWAHSTEEAFAEDVRILFGGFEAHNAAPDTAYGDPRQDPATRRKVAAFISRLISSHPGSKPASPLGLPTAPATSASPTIHRGSFA